MLLNWQFGSPSENVFIAAGLSVINLDVYVQAFFNQRFWAANFSLLVYCLLLLAYLRFIA
jgi:hypothetical protein